MAIEYNNIGPIYLTQAKYDALVAAGTVEAGREYTIVDVETPELFKGTSDPTTATACSKPGDFYLNTTTGKEWKCTAISDSTYTWEKVIGATDIATGTEPGVVKVATTYGMQTSGGFIYPIHATDAKITARATDANGSIMPSNIDFAVKAALTDGVGTAYTTAEQLAARTRIGAQAALSITADWDS